jgi:hypothetical protein
MLRASNIAGVVSKKGVAFYASYPYAGYLSNPPGVLGVETTTLELGPLSGSNLLAMDRAQ